MTRSRWFTRSEAADYLGLSLRTVARYLATPDSEPGSIPHHRLPGKRIVRFDPDEIDAWVRMGSPPAADFARLYRGERAGAVR